MRQFTAVFLIAAFISGCAPISDRPLDAADLVFGKFPASETVRRLKVPCHFVRPDTNVGWFFPVGDYTPIAADFQGIFYDTPGGRVPDEYKHPTLLGGIHFPFEARASSPPFLWVRAVNMEWGTQLSSKTWPLPDQCWKPYGTTIAIVHKGVEVPLR